MIQGKKEIEANNFYKHILRLLDKQHIPFMVGGTYAFTAYTDIFRPTKDMDIFSTPEVYPSILKIANKAGFLTELLDERWIAKIHEKNFTTDIIFAEKNGLNKVNQSWFAHSPTGSVLGYTVKLMPLEEMILSKSFIQNHNRYDGPDVIHLILRRGTMIDWHLLLTLMDPYWEVLFAHLINFSFVYPTNRNIIPKWVMETMTDRLKLLLSEPETHDRVTRGLLFSMEYKVSIEQWGYQDISRQKVGFEEE